MHNSTTAKTTRILTIAFLISLVIPIWVAEMAHVNNIFQMKIYIVLVSPCIEPLAVYFEKTFYLLIMYFI